jgi:presenilin-like A22 family membrane protease
MKHTAKVTLILTTMFLITQLIGLFVVSVYNSPDNTLPFGMEPPEEIEKESPTGIFISILISFILAIALFLVLSRIKAERFIRFWFFAVTSIAIALTLNTLLIKANIIYPIIVLVIALPLAYFKIYKRNMYIHNLTELAIYPGIGAVFVSLLNVPLIIILLFAISLYDIWAVWHSGFMQKMAKYQMEQVKIFAGFFIPYASKKEKKKLKQIKQKYKNKSEEDLDNALKKEKIKINLAILGGGDVVFPIITAGVFYKFAGIIPALIIIASATISLLLLFASSRKGKFYPAMPFLSIGMYIGMLVSYALA